MELAQITKDAKMEVRLTSGCGDAVANDVMYHRDCLIVCKRKAEYIQKADQQYSDSKSTRTIVDMEFLAWLVQVFSDQSYQSNTNDLNSKYQEIMSNHGFQDHYFNTHFKKHIKELILDNLNGVLFVPSIRANSPETVCSSATVSFSVDALIKHSESDIWVIHEAAKILRKSILSTPNWKFTGNFTADMFCPPELTTFLKWMMFDNENKMTEFRKTEISRITDIVGQLIVGNCKTYRQVSYKGVQDPMKEKGFYQKESPLAIGTGLSIYSKTRKKMLVEELSSLNMSCSYKKVQEIENCIYDYCCEKDIDEHGIFIPGNLSKIDRLFCAIDNADFRRDTKDGKDQLHATIITVFQNKSSENDENQIIEIPRKVNKSKNSHTKIKSTDIEFCIPPKVFSTKITDYRGTVLLSEKEYQEADQTWGLLQQLDNDNKIPTWKSYNSKLTPKPDKTTTVAMLPLIKSSPTDFSTLYTALKVCQGISTSITPGKKTIITLDLQLYIKAIQLSSKAEICTNYIFRIGELHTVFAMSKAVGRITENSGLDQLFVHCGIYGPTTLGQILDGKHMKRCVSAFSILYSSLFEIMASAFFEVHEQMKSAVQQIVAPILMEIQVDPTTISHQHSLLVTGLKSIQFYKKFREFRDALQKQGKYLATLMKMIETLFLFIRSTRQELWGLQLVALDHFAKYFFATDLINYARMTPIYLSQMYGLKDEDPETWVFLKKNFCCRKSLKPFTAIGVDHALEQVNKELKVMGGIVGLPEHLLDRYCIIAPTKRLLVDQFLDKFATSFKNRTYDHHESNKRDTKFHNEAVVKYSEALSEFLDNPTLDFTSVFNVMTHSVLDRDEDLLQCEDIGEALLTKFITTRKEGATAAASVWDKMTRRNLRTFRNAAKVIQIRLKDKIVHLREERGLMTRLLVLAKSRKEINLAELFKKHEFSVTPRSLFSPDGLPWKCKDKSAFLTGMESVLAGVALDLNVGKEDLVAIDCLGIVHQLKIHEGIATLADLATQFVNRIKQETQHFDRVALVFDRYDTLKPSLKQQTWDDRANGKQVQYNLTPKTIIKDTKLKELLSHPVNKQHMCDIFAKQSIEMLQKTTKQFVIGYGTTIVSNMRGWMTQNHDHDEADTLIVCIVREVLKLENEQLKVRIVSPDTDVLMLALHLTANIANSNIVFEVLSSKYRRQIDVTSLVNSIGRLKSIGLLSAYVFTGCDQVGKFSSISKARALTTYMDCSDDLIDDLQKLGQDFNEISESTIKAVARYIMLLYTKKKEDRDVISKFGDCGDLRWHLFSKHQQETDTLPPTPDALKFHIQRADYVCGIWKLQIYGFNPQIPCPTYHGWEMNEGKLVAVMTDQLPATKFSIEMNSCSCKKTQCVGGRCSCSSNGLRCTELCKCVGCQNEDLRFDTIGEEESSNDQDNESEQDDDSDDSVNEDDDTDNLDGQLQRT